MNIQLTSADEKKLRYQEISSRFDKLMKALFRQHGAHLDINILSSNEAMDFIQEHTDIPVSYTHLTLPTTPYV